MSAPAFDTLKFQQRLSEVMEPRTATAMAEAFAEATQNFATKTDLDLLRHEFRAELNGIRSEMNGLRGDVTEKLRQQFVMNLAAMTALLGAAVAIIKLT